VRGGGEEDLVTTGRGARVTHQTIIRVRHLGTQQEVGRLGEWIFEGGFWTEVMEGGGWLDKLTTLGKACVSVCFACASCLSACHLMCFMCA
jgi:hypothetical protein